MPDPTSAAPEPTNVSDVRAQFPALRQDQVYFDNAGGSQTLGTVIESIRHYLCTNNVQLGASYRVGKASTERYNAGAAAGARYINADPDEIVYGSSTTQLFRNLAHALTFAPGDEIVVSALDHEANIGPWVDLAARQNLVLKWWTPTATPGAATTTTNPRLEPATLAPLLSPRTRLVTCTHCSNILGTITDVKAVAATLHAAVPGALLCVDAVAYAPHRPVDVRDLGVDFYCFSWYKVYGPHISMLYASRAAQQHVRSLNHFFKTGQTLDDKLGLAGASYELMQSVPAVLDYFDSSSSSGPTKWEAAQANEAALQATLLDYLGSRPDVFTVYGEPGPDPRVRVPTVAFTVRGWRSRDLVEAVESRTNYGFRWGTFYSVRLAKDVLGLGDDGVVRISMVHYNTIDEVKGIIAAIEAVLNEK